MQRSVRKRELLEEDIAKKSRGPLLTRVSSDHNIHMACVYSKDNKEMVYRRTLVKESNMYIQVHCTVSLLQRMAEGSNYCTVC